MEHFEAWLERVAQDSRPLSPASEAVYRAMWRSLSRAMDGTDWALAREADIERCLGKLKLGKQTRRRYLQLIARVLGDDSPAAALLAEDIVPFKKIPAALVTAEEQAVARELPGLSLRDRALMLLYLGAGLRTGEAVRLLREDVMLDDPIPWVAVRNASGTPVRSAPLNEAASQVLRDWLAAHDAPFVFPGGQDGHMAASSAWRLCRAFLRSNTRRAAELGPRRLRHAFAVRQLSAGEALGQVGKWLGHRNIDSTARLLPLVPPDKRPV